MTDVACFHARIENEFRCNWRVIGVECLFCLEQVETSL